MPERRAPEVHYVPTGRCQTEMGAAVDAALAAIPGARVAMLVVIFDAEEGDPPGLLPTQFASAAKSGKDVSVAYAVDTLREHAAALENYDRQRVAAAESDKGGRSS